MQFLSSPHAVSKTLLSQRHLGVCACFCVPVRICTNQSFCIHAWISKWFGTMVFHNEYKCQLKGLLTGHALRSRSQGLDKLSLDKLVFQTSLLSQPKCCLFGICRSSFWRNFIFYTGLRFHSVVNPFPNKPWFLCVCSSCLLKTL